MDQLNLYANKLLYGNDSEVESLYETDEVIFIFN